MFRSKKALAFIVISAMVLCGGAGVGLFTDAAYASGLSGVGSHGSGILSTLFGKVSLQTRLFDADKASAETDPDTEEETEAPTEATEPTEAPTKPEPQEPTQTEPADEPGSEVVETEPQQEETAPTEEEEVLKQRDVKAQLIIEPLYKDAKRKHKTNAYHGVASFWYNLMERKTPGTEDELQMKVTVSGMLPAGISAECQYIPMADARTFTEQGLCALDLVLYDKDGNIYIPEKPVTVTIESKDLQAQLKDDNAPIVYAYAEDPERAEKYTKKYDKAFYAADVNVYKSDDVNKKLLHYETYDKDKKYKDGEDAVRYHNAKAGLDTGKDKVRFDCDLAAFKDLKSYDGNSHFLLTSQMAKRTLKATSGDAKITVTGALDKGVKLEVTEITKKDAGYRDYVEKTAETLDKDVSDLTFARAFDIKLIDPDTGEEFQPDSDIQVAIDLNDENIEDGGDIEAVHFAEVDKNGKTTEVPEAIDAKLDGETVKFTAEGLSIYVVTYTTDFRWGDYTYSMEEDSEVLLSTILNTLKIDQISIGDVSEVSSSDDTLISITKETTETGSDWRLKSLAPFDTEEKLTITLNNGDSYEITVTYEMDGEATVIEGDEGAVKREYISLEGSWANWKVTVNEGGRRLNGGKPLTLEDKFDDGLKEDARQSIDYGSIRVTGDGVTYDYSGSTGTYIIPDETPVTIAYRTRITVKAGERVTFRGTATLKYGFVSVESTAGIDGGVVIYPSASDVAGSGSNYMVKMYVYADKAMQTGIGGVKFILLDENQRPLEYKLGDNKGQPVTFTTGDDGYVDIELHEEKGDVAIEKNTGYYLEMMSGPSKYQKDNTLYSFMITDDPSYDTGGFYKYYNGDTMKVRLYDAVEGLSVSLRFSGSYALTDEQKENVTAILQKKVGENWVDVESHPYTDTKWGYITFSEKLSSDDYYRVIEENARPWDLPDEILLSTSYYCVINDHESPQYIEPHEFTVDSNKDSVNVVIDNRYEEAQLTITKMNKSTGETLSGAEFQVFRIENGAETGEAVKTYTTDENGKLVIRGGEPYESEVLYGIKETVAPDGYLLPQTDNWQYFYFCNDTYLEPSIRANLPEGADAINLSTTGDMVSLDNQKEKITIPVMKIWQGSTWPSNVDSVTVGLYQSVNGSDPVPVTDELGEKTVGLTKDDPYNNKVFKDLPSRDNAGNDITYSIEETTITINGVEKTPLEAGYVQEYGISDAGVYVVRNRLSTGLTINKEWYDRTGWTEEKRITNEKTLEDQLPVTFDIYRTTTPISDEIKADGITNEEMTVFLNGATKVREGLTLDNSMRDPESEGIWTRTISDLDRNDDAGQKYNYYVLENIPSYGDELYEVNETDGIVKIKNKIAPNAVKLTVAKAALVNDPRTESVNTEFKFTLTLMTEDGKHPIRSWNAGTVETTETIENSETGVTETVTKTKKLITDWDGEVTFKLKPEHSIDLSLPEGVKATVTEAYNPEYTVKSKFNNEDDKEGSSYTYIVSQATANAALTFTNTLRVVCKVKTDSGDQIPFETIKSALNRLRNPQDGEEFTSPWTIYMIEDYDIPATDIVNVGEEEFLILTTESTTDELFPFKGGEEADRATIKRAADGGSMITNAGYLSLENIVLDGNKDYYTSNADGGLVNSSGTLNLNNKAILRNSASSQTGGAVYASGTVNMNNGEVGAELSGNNASSASALYLSGTLYMSYGTIKNNSGASDGAVVMESSTDRIYLSGTSKIFDNTGTADNIAANLYIGVDSDNIVNVSSPGLFPAAKIGITAMEGHMEIGEQFAFADNENTQNLSSFINDKYGYKGKLKDGTSTNVVWDGLVMKIKKQFHGEGTNQNDRFTITISSRNLNRSNYTIDGTLDYTVRPVSGSNPGSIVLRNIKASVSDDDMITISPLPVGEYTITESSSSGSFNYEPVYSIVTEANDPISVNNGTFNTDTDCTVTVTNVRRKATVNLTKSLNDQLATGAVDFPFTIKLTEQDGTPIEGFTLKEGTQTDSNGVASVTFSPSNTAEQIMNFFAPVGAVMTITEADDPNYRVTVSAKTNPSEGEGTGIEDGDADNDNVFVIQSVSDDGADVTFRNERKVAEIELSKVLENKVSTTESFTFELTLTNSDDTKASGYTMYQNEADPEDKIVTDSNGKATKKFSFGAGESSKSVMLSIPEGATLEVEEIRATRTKSSESGEIEETIDLDLFDTEKKVNGQTRLIDLSPREHTFDPVTDSDKSLEFTNKRKTKTITVTNTVNGYSGNTQLFTYTATVTDGAGNDYNANGFTNGVQTFKLADGDRQELVVPEDATLTVEESFIVGYETVIKHGSTTMPTNVLVDEFEVTSDLTLAFTNTQLIKLLLVNQTSSNLEGIQVYNEYSNVMYRVNESGTGQDSVTVNEGHWATVDVEKDTTAILMVRHPNSATDSKYYTVKGTMPEDGYYYTIKNEPSFHEYADPAVMRVYDRSDFEVNGKFRYSVSDSTVTFSEQPLVSFDVNGGAWTTEMEDYHDRDGDRKVYQKAVNTGETVSRPDPDPVYPTAEDIEFLGWTTDETEAKAGHPADYVIQFPYNFDSPVETSVYLWAVWAKEDWDKHVVTVRNESAADLLNITAKLTKDGNPVEECDLVESGSTNDSGEITFSISKHQSVNLKNIPDKASLVLTADNNDVIGISSEFTDANNNKHIFDIRSVERDGTVSFVSGICKITDSGDNLLYKDDGSPAVYQTLEAAFTDYNGTLYTDASHNTKADQAKVKMLIDEYPISKKHLFPVKDVILTTAGKDDQDFPYVGVGDRTTLYRASSFTGETLFTNGNTAAEVTLTDIILDGKEVELAKTANGGLIHLNKAGEELNIEEGTILCNVQYGDYSDGNNSRGGAVYVQNGTLNIEAGLFRNLHSRNGGAIYVNSSGIMNRTGTKGSTRFEDCCAEVSGGAIEYRGTGALTINGGSDNGFRVDADGKTLFDEDGKKIEVSDPGVIFSSCTAKHSTNGNGGAIYIESEANCSIKGCSFTECSAKTDVWDNRQHGGGAIAAIKVNSMTVSHCTFNACDTLTDGGAVFARIKNATSMDFNNCIFSNDSCKGQGGAISVYQMDEANKSKSKLTINGCRIENCSSGTSNGSGGAIQSYLPCMSLINSDFTDCWAGKEGGAINHFYHNSYNTIWSDTELYVKGCEFTRCRAEDRYDPTKPQHYAGGINSKAYKTTIEDSKFTDCVSTLREGGALHLGGRDDGVSGSNATITRCTFKNCIAKTAGGALLASTYTLSVEDSFFYGCKTSGKAEGENIKPAEDGGGAISHSENRRNNSTQNKTVISNCVFSDDPDGGEDAQSCSTATNGGAIWTRAKDVTIEKCTINGCTAAGNGGAVYLYKNGSQTATISGEKAGDTIKGTISNCEAVMGSAVYVYNLDKGTSVTFSTVSITGNTCSVENSGAVHGGTLNFEGDTIVKENTYSGDESDHNVVMPNNDNTTIYTTGNGLTVNAEIGVYTTTGNPYNNHGKEGKPFGTWKPESGSNYLDSFVNDREPGLYGYQSITDDNDKLIYWGSYICKITDEDGNTLKRLNGRDAVYPRISLAFGDFINVKNNRDNDKEPRYVKMLVEEYQIHQSTQINNFPAASMTLTTEKYTKDDDRVEGEYDGKHPYRGTKGTVCTISPNSGNNSSLFYLDYSSATFTFTLEDITLDGRKDSTATKGNCRLIMAANGSLIINDGTTMQYGYNNGTGDRYGGGAIYTTYNGSASVEINGEYDAEKKTAGIRFLNCIVEGQKNGGAIWANDLTINSTSNNVDQPGTVFTDCVARRGGAICVNGATTTINGILCKDCQSLTEAGAIYHLNEDATSTTIQYSKFEGCHSTDKNNQWSYGGAVHSKAKDLTVSGCSFTDCYSNSNGGAIYHGHVDNKHNPSNIANRENTSISDTVFKKCEIRDSVSNYGNGGSVYTQAMTVEITNCSFSKSTAIDNGGALYCRRDESGSSTTISGTTFEQCSANNGSGGAVCSKTKSLTLQNDETKTSISSCTASQYSGAVHMETSASNLKIKGNTKISGCYAKMGGAIYLKNTVTMDLTDSPEFTNNGYTTQGGSVVDSEQGACIYLAEGSRLNLSGSPKFSRNILPNEQRITNGGISDNVRQDIFLAGYASKNPKDTNADSIHVTGKLTSDENMIWVWPEQSPHRLPNEQFAKIDGSDIDDGSLSCLRNALADSTTGCSNGEYLAGVRVGNDTENIYWDKMYTVSFKKKDNKAVGVPGAEFTLYKDKECRNEVAKARSIDGEGQRKGMVEFTSIRIGAYYMKETRVPESFKANDVTYLVLVGSPYLSKNDISRYLWEDGEPLDVQGAEILVPRLTTDVHKYYGIFPLDENNKAVLKANLASSTVGIENIRSDYQAYFMKVDGAGKALPGAEFTIYTQMLDEDGNPETLEDGYPKLMKWSRDGETYPAPVESADGTNKYKDIDNNPLDKGVVYFRELPLGTYYLLETEYPERNGDNRRTYFVESDRVFKLVVKQDEHDQSQATWELYEWHEKDENEADPYYTELGKNTAGIYEVSNEEAVCKLTDSNDKLLYVEGHPVWNNNNNDSSDKRRFHAVYPTLEKGFNAAQNEKLVYGDGETVADDANNPALKLQALKDLTLTQPVTYTSSRALTFTTASTNATSADKYVFSTTRTSDTARAEIKRGYTELDTDGNPANGALITINNNANMTLTNINLNGMNSNKTGRALHVIAGKLNIGGTTLLQNFKQTVASNDGGVRGGAILMEDGTELAINGGSNRSAVFSHNVVIGESGDAEGGAIALGHHYKVSISNAQFTANRVQASGDNAGNGGAVSLGERIEVTLTNGVFTSNAAVMGSAIYVGEKSEVTIQNGSIKGNKASGENGGAINLAGDVIDDGGNINDTLAKIKLEGNPVIYDNTDDSTGKNQRNIVLSADSNGVINTTGSGLGSKAKIGVYVIDGENLFDKHGKSELPFGTFDNTDNNRNHPEVFHNDRDTALHGVLSKAENETDEDYYIIYWSVHEGGRRVILRKVTEGNSYVPKEGAKFLICSAKNEKSVITNGGTEKEPLVSDSSGVFFIGDLPYSTYYIRELEPNEGWATLIVTKEGIESKEISVGKD